MVTSKTGNYFESKIRTERVMENGMQAKVNELYVVEALTFSDCEYRVSEYMSSFASGEFDVMTEQRAKYKEIFISDNPEDDTYYKARVDFITLDEHSGKEKHSKVDYLVMGHSVESAQGNIDEGMKGTMIDYKILSVGETSILDVVYAEKKEEQ